MHVSPLGLPTLKRSPSSSHTSTTSNTPKQPTPRRQGHTQEAHQADWVLRSGIPITPANIPSAELALTNPLRTPSSSNLGWVAMGSLLGFSLLPKATALTLTEIESLVSSLNTTSVAQTATAVAQTATAAAHMGQMMQIEGTLRSTQEEFLLFQQFTTILNLTANTAIEKLSVEIDRSKSLESKNTTLTIALVVAGFVILATAIIELRSYLSKCSLKNQNAHGRPQPDALEEVVVHNPSPSRHASASASSLANTGNQRPLNVGTNNPLPISLEIVNTNSTSSRASSFNHEETHLQRDPRQSKILHIPTMFSPVAGIAGNQPSPKESTEAFPDLLANDASSEGSSFESLDVPAAYPQTDPIPGQGWIPRRSHSPCFSPTGSHISIVDVPNSDTGPGVNPNPLQTFQASPRADSPLSAYPPTRRRLDASLAPLSAADVQGRTDVKPAWQVMLL